MYEKEMERARNTCQGAPDTSTVPFLKLQLFPAATPQNVADII